MQTTMTQDPEIGQSGQLFYPPPSGGVVTKFTEGALVAAGLGVIGGTAQDDVKPPAATFTTKWVGIVIYKDTHPTNTYADKSQIAVCREGFVLVSYEPDTDPTADTPIFVRHTANGAGKLTLGAIRANADSANAVAAPNGMFRKVWASQKKALVELSGHVQ